MCASPPSCTSAAAHPSPLSRRSSSVASSSPSRSAQRYALTAPRGLEPTPRVPRKAVTRRAVTRRAVTRRAVPRRAVTRRVLRRRECESKRRACGKHISGRRAFSSLTRDASEKACCSHLLCAQGDAWAIVTLDGWLSLKLRAEVAPHGPHPAHTLPTPCPHSPPRPSLRALLFSRSRVHRAGYTWIYRSLPSYRSSATRSTLP